LLYSSLDSILTRIEWAGDGSELRADCGRVDDGQTILSVLKQSVWPSSVVPIQRTADGLDGQTNSISFETICLAVERRTEPADCGRVDDGQTNFISFETICLAVKRRTEPADCRRIDDGQTNSINNLSGRRA
jgi:hypothetical protein